MAEVFINYRTGDGEWPAAFLYDKFKRRYGADRVFRDAASLPPGRDFRPKLLQRLEECTILLVIIGPVWLTARDESGRRRLDRPDDYVRFEIEESLRRKIHVLPVTLNDVALPLAHELPAAIADLAHHQKRTFRSREYQTTFKEIVAVVDDHIPLATQSKDAKSGRTPKSNGDRTVYGARRSTFSLGDGDVHHYGQGS